MCLPCDENDVKHRVNIGSVGDARSANRVVSDHTFSCSSKLPPMDILGYGSNIRCDYWHWLSPSLTWIQRSIHTSTFTPGRDSGKDEAQGLSAPALRREMQRGVAHLQEEWQAEVRRNGRQR